MKTIRASEIAAYLYCRRAWWYQKNGLQPQNQMELATGTRYHERHGRSILAVQLIRWLAYALLLAAVVLAAVSML